MRKQSVEYNGWQVLVRSRFAHYQTTFKDDPEKTTGMYKGLANQPPYRIVQEVFNTRA